jgi:hypothetical protein
LDGGDGLRKTVVGRDAVGGAAARPLRQDLLLIDCREWYRRQFLLGEKMARAMASNGFAIGLYLLYRLLGGYVPGCGGKHYRERSG